MRRDAVFVCGGDYSHLEPRNPCPDPLHDWPLPTGYVDAATVAASRIRRGWANVRCPRCGLYGWRAGRIDPAMEPVRIVPTRGGAA